MKKYLFIALLSLSTLTACRKDANLPYRGTISQSGESGPVIKEFTNKIGDVAWERRGPGIYVGVMENPIGTKKHWEIIAQPSNPAESATMHVNENEIQIYTTRDGEFADDVLINVSFEVKVYKRMK